MSRAPFALQYDGAAVVEGVMSVRDFAPALLAFGDLCEQASRELYGDEARVEVQIRAVAPGSVIANLVVTVAGTLGPLLGFVLANPKKATEVLDLVKSAMGLVKEIKGSKESVTKLEADATKLVVEHKHTHDLSDRAFELLRRRAVQRDVITLVAPLKTPGVEHLHMVEGHKVVESVSADEVPYFDALPAIMPTTDTVAETPEEATSIVEKPYRVVSLSSDPKNVWKLDDGSSPISVWVSDKTIHDRAREGVLGIEPGFIIWARIKSVTHLENGELRTKNTLEAILDVKPPRRGEQPPLLGG